MSLIAKIFVVYVLILKVITKINLSNKITIKIKYFDYANNFLPKFVAKFLDYNNNNYAIKLKKEK